MSNTRNALSDPSESAGTTQRSSTPNRTAARVDSRRRPGHETPRPVQTQQKAHGNAQSLALRGDWLAGSWAGDVQRGGHNTEGLSSSSGDLEEGIRAFVAFGDTTPSPVKQLNSPFDRVEAFRKGFHQGVSARSVIR